MEKFENCIEKRNPNRFPKRIYCTVSAEVFDALQRYGMRNVDVLVNNLLANYFENNGVVSNGRNKKQY